MMEAVKKVPTKFTLRGLVPPVFTPLNDDSSINYAAIPDYISYLVKNNIKGILVGGTTGEGPSFSVEERKKLTEAWVAAARPRGVHVMLQVGGAPLPDVLELARHGESLKVDSILTLPELYFKPKTVDELVSYIGYVAKAAPSTPVLYYHIPVFSGVSIPMPSFIRAATKVIPNFKGIKFTSNDLNEGAEALAALSGDQAVFLGADSLWAPALLLGFDSGIGTTFNILPGLTEDITAAVKNNKVEEARRLQEKLNQFIGVLTAEGTWVPVMKVGMEVVTGMKVGPPRQPLVPLTKEQVSRIQTTFKKTGIIKS